ncbi:MAG: hypothetical protein KF810_11990 [Rhizobiaceae bacterium]|nr:hypothetical protein [Rhizobiaceae bacterium]
MTNSKLKTALLMFGCVVAGSAIAEEAGVGTVVAQGDMTMFCQNAAAARFEVQLDAITTDPPVEREGKLLVLGTVDGESHDYGFDCRFEQNGTYLGVFGDPAMSD